MKTRAAACEDKRKQLALMAWLSWPMAGNEKTPAWFECAIAPLTSGEPPELPLPAERAWPPFLGLSLARPAYSPKLKQRA